MSSYEWEEVKRLAADFQRAQLSSNLQRLSERNCLEIINKLIQTKLLDVIFTNDGKTFVTPNHLKKEIKDELYVHGGRINMIDVAKILNVDLDVISLLARDIIKDNTDISIVLGQLIDQQYILHVAEEINEKLQRYGHITINDLTRSFDLPGDYIQSIIKDQMGKIIRKAKQDKQDPLIYYTERFQLKNRAKVKGCILAVTKPTAVPVIMNKCGISNNKEFFSALDSLIDLKLVPGTLTDKTSNSCQYIPHVYVKQQGEWIQNFYKQNGYIKYTALAGTGISDPKSYISKLLGNDHLLYMPNYVISSQILDQVEATIEEAVSSESWIDIVSILPTAFDEETSNTIVSEVLKKNRGKFNVRFFNSTYIVAENFLNKITEEITSKIVSANVQKVISSGKYEQYQLEQKMSKQSKMNDKQGQELSRKDERKKRANVGKSGGGTQGRETKTKATKKKYGVKGDSKMDLDDEEGVKENTLNTLEIITMEEITSFLENSIFVDYDVDCSDLILEIASTLNPSLNELAFEKASNVYEEYVSNSNSNRRKKNTELQDTMLSHLQDIKQYKKAIKLFPDNTKGLLIKYLLKNDATSLINTFFTFISDNNDEVNTNEDRLKVISALEDKEIKEAATNLHKSLNGNSMDDFVNDVEDAFALVNVVCRKVDKKKERSYLEGHREALIGKLLETNDAALVLHLATLILFQTHTGLILNASGRFVASILTVVKEYMDNDTFSTLRDYHGEEKFEFKQISKLCNVKFLFCFQADLVLKMLSQSIDETEKEDVKDKLTAMTPAIKQIVLPNKKV